MKIAVFANAQKPRAQEVLNATVAHLHSRGVDVCLALTDSPRDMEKTVLTSIIEKVDLIISIGGDGSILHLVQHIGIPSCPLVGINLGSLGFLADIRLDSLESSLDAVCDGQYDVSKRGVLRTVPSGIIQGFAINEVVVHRGELPHLIDLVIRVDGKFVNTFSADGIILATPGGSTAYSLAAGGPIVTPNVACVVLTPICPHTISNRPMVLFPEYSISVELLNEESHADVTFDGQKPFLLPTGQLLELQLCPQQFNLATLNGSEFYETLRKKLGWTGSLRGYSTAR